MVERVFPHRVHYPDNYRIPLSDVAATLLAYEKLAPILGRLLEELSSGLVVEKVAISVDKIESGSLSEAFFVAIFAVFQKELSEEVPLLVESLTGLQVSERYDTVVTVLFLILLFYGARYLFEGGRKKKGAVVPPAIVGDNNIYVGIAAEQIGVSPDEMERAVRAAVGKRDAPKVARAAVDFFRPAKRGGNGRIVPGGLPEISKETTSAFPSEATISLLTDDAVPTPVPEADLEIRATDRDKADHGWAGRLIMPGFTTKRLPLKLYPTVDREELARRETARVEAVLEQRPTEAGDLRPSTIHVVRLLDQE